MAGGRLAEKVAIVTGAAQGMGEEHARLFVAEGARVVLTDVAEEAGTALADALGDAAMFVRHDVSREAEWTRVTEACAARFGPATILVNNAGVAGRHWEVHELPEADYRRMCDVNQIGVFLGMKAVLPGMIAAGGGSIVNVSSLAGMIAFKGSNLAYVASKFAVRGMTKQVAVDYGDRGIRCNAVMPGYIKTPMLTSALEDGGGPMVQVIPLGRLAEAVEVARLVLFLASDESSYISGTEQVIDGGVSASLPRGQASAPAGG